MWEKPEKKTLFTLNIDGYAPEVTDLTFPLLNHYAEKIGADFHVIKERKYPDWPPVYEKLQIFDLAKEMGNDWNIFMDADTLVNPSMPDITLYLTKDTVLHNGMDHAPIRWFYDHYFKRDGRFIGSCDWLAVGSDWCLDLWHPLEDLTLEEASKRIFVTNNEYECRVMEPHHLIDDFTLSRNIARFGLKHKTFIDIQQQFNIGGFLWHIYTKTNEEKVRKIKDVLRTWRVL